MPNKVDMETLTSLLDRATVALTLSGDDLEAVRLLDEARELVGKPKEMQVSELSRARSTLGLIGGNWTQHVAKRHPERGHRGSLVSGCEICERLADAYVRHTAYINSLLPADEQVHQVERRDLFG